jgi:hypothetical protein
MSGEEGLAPFRLGILACVVQSVIIHSFISTFCWWRVDPTGLGRRGGRCSGHARLSVRTFTRIGAMWMGGILEGRWCGYPDPGPGC